MSRARRRVFPAVRVVAPIAASFAAVGWAALGWAAADRASAARADRPSSEPLALRHGLYVEIGCACAAPSAPAKIYDGSTLKARHAGQCRSERLWSLQGVQRLRQACLIEDGRWLETGRPYVRVLDPEGFEIVEVRPDAVERPPMGRRAVRYRHCSIDAQGRPRERAGPLQP